MVNLANLCIFEGRIAKAPQFSTVQMGNDTVEKAIFSIAVDRALSSAQRQKVKNGDQTIKTVDFVTFSLLGGQVDVLRQYFPQGKSIRVMSHYTEYTTTDQQSGQKKYGHMFEADSIGFTVQDSKNLQNNNGGGQNAGGGQPQNNNQSGGYQQQPQQQAAGFSMFDEENQPF